MTIQFILLWKCLRIHAVIAFLTCQFRSGCDRAKVSYDRADRKQLVPAGGGAIQIEVI